MGFWHTRFTKPPSHTHNVSKWHQLNVVECIVVWFYDSRRCVLCRVRKICEKAALFQGIFSWKPFFDTVNGVWSLEFQIQLQPNDCEWKWKREKEGVNLFCSIDNPCRLFVYGCEWEQRLSINISIYVFGSTFAFFSLPLLFIVTLFFEGFFHPLEQMTNI